MELRQPISAFDSCPGVDGWFTLKNSHQINEQGVIPGLNCGLNTLAPADEVLSNRQKLFQYLNLDSHRVAFADQVHGVHVEVVTAGGSCPDTDAMITSLQNLCLVIQVADCGAILMADPVNRVIAAVHAGWRGAIGNILPRTVSQMVEHCGAEPSEIRAYLSPCISVRHFEVGKEVAEQFPDEFVNRQSWDKPHIDLKSFLNQQLLNAGVQEKYCRIDPGCTYRDESSYYSYRREKRYAGRMLAGIQLT